MSEINFILSTIFLTISPSPTFNIATVLMKQTYINVVKVLLDEANIIIDPDNQQRRSQHTCE